MTTGVLSTSFPRYQGDFAGCFVEDAVRALALAGETVEVIAAGAARTRPELVDRVDRVDLVDLVDDDGASRFLPSAVSVLRIAMPAVSAENRLFFGAGAPEMLERGGALAWAQAFWFWAALCERVRTRAPLWDRIAAHWLVPCALAARAVAPHLPLTAYAHSGDIALLERIPGGAALGRKLARETDDLIFVSSDLRRRFARLTGVAVGRVARVLPEVPGANPVLPTGAAATAMERQAQPGACAVRGAVILSVGRLVPIKGFDVLLRAIALAAAADTSREQGGMKVVILGEGPEHIRLATMAGRLGIDLELPGLVPRRQVRHWMSVADLYVQPSRQLPSGRTEGVPVATLEALSAGLPVIASATGGLAELKGISLVPAQNPAALADCLLRAVRAAGPRQRVFTRVPGA